MAEIASASGIDNTIKAQFRRDHNADSEIHDRARLCAALSKPYLFPPEEQLDSQRLPENFQSVAARGITNLEGRMLLSLYPVGQPWFQLVLAEDIRTDPAVPDEIKLAISEALFLRELVIQAALESSNLKNKKNQRRSGFRSQKRVVIGNSLVTGDALEMFTEDLRLKVFRRDHYVTRRDGAADVLYHIVREEADPMRFTDEDLAKVNLSTSDLERKPVSERLMDLYTMVEWQPRAGTWVIKQELNDRIMRESEEPVSPMISTPYDLVAGEHYGRGLIELNLGDVRSFDQLREKLIDFATMASKHFPFLDQNSTIREEELLKPSGTVLRGNVSGGVLQDVGWLKLDRINDFRVVAETAEQIRKDLGMAMLLEAETQPRGDRVTATQIGRIAAELEGASGGVYSSVADDQQLPTLQRASWQLEKDRSLPPLPEESVRVNVLTGVAALSREIKATKLVSFTQLLQQFPAAAARIDPVVWGNLLAQYNGIFEPGLIKSDEQVALENQQALQQQTRQEAASKAVDVAGNVAEASLSPQAEPQQTQPAPQPAAA